MHMHTVKVAILERRGRLRLRRVRRRGDGPARPAAAVPAPGAAWTRSGSTTRCGSPTSAIDPTRHIFRVAVPDARAACASSRSSSARSSASRSTGRCRCGSCTCARGSRAAGSRSSPSCTTRSPTATPPTTCSANATGRDRAGGRLGDRRSSGRRRGASWSRMALRRRRRSRRCHLPGPAQPDGRRRWSALVKIRRGSDVSPPRPILDVPRTSFNGAARLAPQLRDRRRSRWTTSRTVKHAHGVTLNDVVLGGGRRARCAAGSTARGERPSSSLTAGVPVGTDPPGLPPRLAGNRVSNLFTTLATDVDDPLERLRTISRVTDARPSSCSGRSGPDMLIDWVQFTPPAPFGAVMRLYSRMRAASWHPAPFNVVVSNVAGPARGGACSATPGWSTCSASARSSRASGST